MKNYRIKRNKDKEVALNLAIRELNRVKNKIEEQITYLTGEKNNIDVLNIETFGTKDKVFFTRSVK